MTFIHRHQLAAIKTRSILRMGRQFHCTALRVPANDIDGGEAA